MTLESIDFESFLNLLKSRSLFLLLILATVFTLVILLKFSKRLKIKWYAAAVISVLFTVTGLLLVKVFAFMESGFEKGSFGGQSIFGAVLFEPILIFTAAKLFHRDLRTAFDVMTPCLISTLLLARVNCIIQGCCLGLKIPGTENLRYPTRELEIAFYIVLFVIIIIKLSRDELHGRAYPLYMMSYGAFRFVIEFFRVSGATTKIFHLSHIWAIVALLVGAAFLAELSVKKPDEKHKHEIKHKSR